MKVTEVNPNKIKENYTLYGRMFNCLLNKVDLKDLFYNQQF